MLLNSMFLHALTINKSKEAYWEQLFLIIANNSFTRPLTIVHDDTAIVSIKLTFLTKALKPRAISNLLK
jgi:hypothetical protein